MNESEPGLFSKGDMLLSVYVDDSFLSGPDLQECREEMNGILAHFEGKEVKPTKVHTDGTEERDLLGATLLYNHTEPTLYWQSYMTAGWHAVILAHTVPTPTMIEWPSCGSPR